MQKKSNSITNRKYLNKQIVLLFVIVVYFISLSVTLGRYVVKKINTYISQSKEFYFYSDKLSDNEREYPVTWSGTEECVIPINLYSKLNNLKKATRDIEYKVECEMISSNATYTLSKQEGVISKDTNNDVFTISVIPNNFIEDDEKVTVVVKVTTLDDFEKTLTAKFVIKVNNDTVKYKIDDARGRDYFNLIINNTQKENVTVEFDPSKIIIDTTNNIFSSLNEYGLSNSYINKIDFNMEPFSNISIRFFKKNRMKDYSDDETIIIFNHSAI